MRIIVLRRLLRDMEDIQQKKLDYVVPTIDGKEECLVANEGSKITLEQVYLEDLNLTAKKSPDVTNWARWIGQQAFPSDEEWQQMLIERFCLVPDDIFNFIIDTATEITARIKLREDSKTVQDGGLWYEEALPAETILSGIALATPTVRSKKSTVEVLAVLSGFGKGIGINYEDA